MASYHQSAIALNNQSVSLCEEGKYAAALKTLESALDKMKNANDATKSFKPIVNVRTSIQSALSNRIECDVSKKIVRLSDDADTSSLVEALKRCELSLLDTILISFDDDSSLDTSSRDWIVDFGIILHNLGATLLWLAKLTHEQSTKDRFCLNALKVFKACRSLLASRANHVKGEILYDKIIRILAVVMNGMIQTFATIKRKEDVKACCRSLHELVNTIRERDALFASYDEPQVAAAA